MSDVTRYNFDTTACWYEHPDGEFVEHDAYAKLAAEAQALREEIKKAQNALAFTEQWYGVRHERLWHWAHAELNEEQKRRYFNIVANGTAEHSEPPTFAQQLCRTKHRYECAEKEVAALRARVVVVPERDARRMDTEYPEGWNDCLDELARLGLLRRVCAEPPATCCMDDEMTWRRDLDSALLELRALLNQDKENGNG
ncbi:TPA: hypothetical protein L3939_006561 [Pseudomonas aeruginosa]|nr:hypothetical protein [Pseudomonas aeruginosa]HBN9723527.1 hypothetical protein [Pseudomonas aeruginosa]HBN9771706.1 hypothetical protein [Pseudomonas aeruginosa]HBN9893449.1 hypothetical protein [Pseudomonas aeruginosa]